MVKAPPQRIGLSGTGFIARQLARALARTEDLRPTMAFTARPPGSVTGFPESVVITGSLETLLDHSELVFECSGDPRKASEVVAASFERGMPVVTMNAEFHVTCGSWFVGRGYLTEAHGDQPGALAQLALEAQEMGFRPLVYGNYKRFLDHHPTEASMHHWAATQGISLEQVTSFTDGTKLQIEQALVANGLRSSILRSGLLGPSGKDRLLAASELAGLADRQGNAIADYLIDRDLPPGVFLTATHDSAEQAALAYMKLGEGPYYLLERPYHLCALEAPRTIRAALRGDAPLLNNSSHPRVSVSAIAKRDLPRGHRIQRGLGSFDCRGEAVLVEEHPDHVPIGILFDALLREPIEAGAPVTWSDVDLPETLASRLVRQALSASAP